MSVNSIATGSMATHQLQSIISAGTETKQLKGTSPSKDTSSTQTLKPSAVDPNVSNKTFLDKVPSPVVANQSSADPAGVVAMWLYRIINKEKCEPNSRIAVATLCIRCLLKRPRNWKIKLPRLLNSPVSKDNGIYF